MTTQTNISKLKVTELKALCRERGLRGYSRKKKSELIDYLNNGVQTSDLNEPKKTTWGSIKSFFSKKAESLKSTI